MRKLMIKQGFDALGFILGIERKYSLQKRG